MIYSVNYLELSEKINPFQFAKYLKNTGWSVFQTKKEFIKIFQIITAEGNAFQVTIPMDRNLSDYKSAMYRAVETVSYVEGQSVEKLILFLLNPNADILKIRLEKQGVEAGNIFFDDAIRLFENTKKLIAATAQDVVHPKSYHRGRVEDSISKFVNNCKFGQTEVGSYIISVICPFAELDEKNGFQQLGIFANEEQCAKSLTRNVTNRIMSNICFIKKNIDNGDLDALVSGSKNNLISVNFYEALTGLSLDAEDSNVEFVAQWSPTVKKNREVSNSISLSHNYYQPITDITNRIRNASNQKTKIVGRIKKLDSVPDAAKRESGKITIVYLDENEKRRTLTASLRKADYDEAIKAHCSGSYIELIGEIANSGSRNIVMNYESFNVLD